MSHSEPLTKYRGTQKCKYPLECDFFKFTLIFSVFISYCHHSWLTGQCKKRGTFLNAQLPCLLVKLLSSLTGNAVEKHVVPQDLVWELPLCPADCLCKVPVFLWWQQLALGLCLAPSLLDLRGWFNIWLMSFLLHWCILWLASIIFWEGTGECWQGHVLL